MRVLIICSGNPKIPEATGILQPFIKEQIVELRKSDLEIDVYQIHGKGFWGYIKNYPYLCKKIRKGNFDILHAHYGLSGLLTALNTMRPLVITFHGSDINNPFYRILSNIAFLLSTEGIFVSAKLIKKLYIKSSKKTHVIPCGVDLKIFYPIEKKLARNQLMLDQGKKYVLFSSNFDNPVKNFQLAKMSVALIPEIEIIELKNKTRREVNLLLNACDALILTSVNEGSPQIIKEALACNCPVVSVDVGDVKSIIGKTKGCYICKPDPELIAEKIRTVLKNNSRTNGRERVLNLDLKVINLAIISLYKKSLNFHK